MNKTIPIVIVTANRTPRVYRQVISLMSQEGGRETPILISVDGQNEETRRFGLVLDIPVIFHNNPAKIGKQN